MFGAFAGDTLAPAGRTSLNVTFILMWMANDHTTVRAAINNRHKNIAFQYKKINTHYSYYDQKLISTLSEIATTTSNSRLVASQNS